MTTHGQDTFKNMHLITRSLVGENPLLRTRQRPASLHAPLRSAQRRQLRRNGLRVRRAGRVADVLHGTAFGLGATRRLLNRPPPQLLCHIVVDIVHGRRLLRCTGGAGPWHSFLRGLLAQKSAEHVKPHVMTNGNCHTQR